MVKKFSVKTVQKIVYKKGDKMQPDKFIYLDTPEQLKFLTENFNGTAIDLFHLVTQTTGDYVYLNTDVQIKMYNILCQLEEKKSLTVFEMLSITTDEKSVDKLLDSESTYLVNFLPNKLEKIVEESNSDDWKEILGISNSMLNMTHMFATNKLLSFKKSVFDKDYLISVAKKENLSSITAKQVLFKYFLSEISLEEIIVFLDTSMQEEDSVETLKSIFFSKTSLENIDFDFLASEHKKTENKFKKQFISLLIFKYFSEHHIDWLEQQVKDLKTWISQHAKWRAKRATLNKLIYTNPGVLYFWIVFFFFWKRVLAKPAPFFPLKKIFSKKKRQIFLFLL